MISLLDALISIVILNIGFLLILSVIPATGVLIKHSENSLLAKQIAQTYIEFYGSPAHWSGDFSSLTNLPGMTYGSNEIVQTRTGFYHEEDKLYLDLMEQLLSSDFQAVTGVILTNRKKFDRRFFEI